MNNDLDALTQIRDLSSSDFELFKTAAKTLVTKTFIIRGLDKERELYTFTVRNIALFSAWFSCMDTEVVYDEGLGVIAFRGSPSTRLWFSREEICGALALRLLYEEKRNEVVLTTFPSITVADFKAKYNALTGSEIRKTVLETVLKRLLSCKLIESPDRDFSNDEVLILLYPSIPMSIGRDALDNAVKYLESSTDQREGSPLDETRGSEQNETQSGEDPFTGDDE